MKAVYLGGNVRKDLIGRGEVRLGKKENPNSMSSSKLPQCATRV